MLVDPYTYQQRLNLCHSCPYHVIWLGGVTLLYLQVLHGRQGQDCPHALPPKLLVDRQLPGLNYLDS